MRAIRQIAVRGSHRERGIALGRRLRGTFAPPPEPGVPGDFVDACMAEARRVHPPCIEEFEGLVHGGDFDRAPMAAYYFARLFLAIVWRRWDEQCTRISARTAWEIAGIVWGRR